MKRKVLFMTIIALVALTLTVSATDISFKVAVGQSTSASLDITANSGTDFNFDIDAELDIGITRRQGVMIGIHPYAADGSSVKFGFGAGYMFMYPVNKDVDFVLTAGPEFEFGGSSVDLALFVMADFDFQLGEVMFVRLGTGVRVDLGPMNSDFCDDVEVFIPLPSLGIGWKF